MLGAPVAIRIIVAAAVAVALWLALNWAYQVIRKPTELFFPVSGALTKAPPETWRQYGPLFLRHSTSVMTPELLAALAQVEGAGQPGGADLLALAPGVESVRVVPAGLERGGHVPDHRRDVRAGEALLHPRPRGDRGRSPRRRALVLVQFLLHARAAEPRRRADRRPAGSERRRYDRAAAESPRRRSLKSRTWPPSSTCAEAARATPMPGGASG
jgi:hypothetical protein